MRGTVVKALRRHCLEQQFTRMQFRRAKRGWRSYGTARERGIWLAQKRREREHEQSA
jgi:hypothetical protein